MRSAARGAPLLQDSSGSPLGWGSNASPLGKKTEAPLMVAVGVGLPLAAICAAENSTTEPPLIFETQRSPLPSNANPNGKSREPEFVLRVTVGVGLPDAPN